jgi:hypothetical protein
MISRIREALPLLVAHGGAESPGKMMVGWGRGAHCKQTDGVDCQRVNVGVAHDCDLYSAMLPVVSLVRDLGGRRLAKEGKEEVSSRADQKEVVLCIKAPG